MSGPKLVGITYDEAVIRRNGERLRQIGKKAYYTELFINTNTDVENTKTWISNYASDTVGKVAYGDTEVRKMLRQIDEVKREYGQILEQNKLDMSLIEEKTAAELNDFVCGLVINISVWKKQCIESISEILAKLQQLCDKIRGEYRETEKKKKEWEASRRRRKQEAEDSLHMAVKRSQVSGSERFEKITLAGKAQEKPDEQEEEMEYTLTELAFIENVKNELERFKKLDILGKKEKKMIADISYYLPMLDLKDDTYTMNGKRNVLETVKFNYYVLTKKIAEMQAEIESEQGQRRICEMEYITFCDALDEEKEDIEGMTLEELSHKVETLRKKVEKQESRIYAEDAITEIMHRHGYKGISSVHLHEAEVNSRIIFSDEDDKKICTSFGNGTIMMQVVGEGSAAPTEHEVQSLVEQQGAFCDLYPEIKKELEERQIHIVSENCAPVSAESAVNISIQRQKDIGQKTKRHSVLKHRKYGQNGSRYRNVPEAAYADRHQAMYVDRQ